MSDSCWRTLVKRVVKGLIMNERGFVTMSRADPERAARSALSYCGTSQTQIRNRWRHVSLPLID
jgi:hypothetical protein